VFDGQAHGYYEWSGAGIYQPGQAVGGSMYQGGGTFEELFYGFSLEELFVRLDPARGTDCSGELRILLTHGKQESTLRMELRGGVECPVLDERGTRCGAGRSGAIVELSISLAALGIAPGDRIGMLLRHLRDEAEVDRLPRYGELELVAPDPRFERTHWHV